MKVGTRGRPTTLCFGHAAAALLPTEKDEGRESKRGLRLEGPFEAFDMIDVVKMDGYLI